MLSQATRDSLVSDIYSTKQTSESSLIRLSNIKWVEGMQRSGLTWGQKEKQIHIASTSAGERLFIQYPGKETVLSGRRRIVRPWDFRPKVELVSGEYGADLSFQHIWDILLEVIDRLTENRVQYTRALAVVFYRMAFMCDHDIAPGNQVLPTRLLAEDALTGTPSGAFIEEIFPALYIYSLPEPVLKELSEVFGDFGNMSLEAFLLYNDLLAWNEDCKYYHRSLEKNPDDWIGGVGRVNNLLTHVSVLGFKIGEVKLSEMLMRFIRNFGVSPATRRELRAICGDFLDP